MPPPHGDNLHLHIVTSAIRLLGTRPVAYDYPGCPSVTTVNTFDNFGGSWVIGLLRTQTVTSDGQTTKTAREYYSSGLLKSETAGVDNPLTTTYERNSNGLVTAVTRSGAAMAERRETASDFGPHGLPQTVTNAAGHVTTLAYDSRFGTVTSQTDPNGLVTTCSFDSLGRPTEEVKPDGSTATTTYASTSSYGAKIVAATVRNSAPDEATYTDLLDRVVARTQVGGSGQTLVEQTTYLANGLVGTKRALGVANSEQYFYDGQQRVTSLAHANGLVTDYAYAAAGSGQGLTTTITESVQVRTEQRNARGQVTSVTTPEGASLVTDYSGLGYVKQTNASGAVTTYTRDDRGLLTAQNDPDLGSWTYSNDATGQVVSQTDARGNVTTVTYDGLGRMIARTIAGETSSWAYDGTASGNKLGRLRLVTGPGGFRRAFYYDVQARPVLEVADIRGQFFNIATAYGSYGRVERVEYRWRPLGLEGPDFFGNAKWYSFGAAYTYSDDGFVTAVRDTAGREWWAGPTYNDLGKVTAFTYGNGLATACEFDGNTGAMKSTQSSVQHLSFEYDTLGNLTRREDHVSGAVNTYGYDGLNRLTSITGPGAASMGYDAQGNLSSRNGVAYAYTGGDSGGPHAVKRAGGTAYRYDACGNVTARGADSIQWTAFNRPSRMVTGNATTDFAYDGDLQRVAEIGSDGVVKVFVAPGFEQYQRNGETETRIYLSAPSGTVGLRGFVEKATPTIRPGGVVEASRETIQYYHADHLGSVLQTTGASGSTSERYSFDGWGSRTTQTAAGDGALPADRGFTGHEELSAHRLVHMNARLYEPAIGRMLSPDTVIQAPLNPQNYNRYTYVANNPLSLTDPSGHMYGEPDQVAPDTAGKQGGAIVGRPTVQSNSIQSQLLPGGTKVPGSTPTNSGAAAPNSELTSGDASAGAGATTINVGEWFLRKSQTNALQFDGTMGSVLVVYSNRELGQIGGNSTCSTLAAYSDRNILKGRIRTVDLDGLTRGGDIAGYVNGIVGDERFANIVLMRHGGMGGDGDERMLAYYDPKSALMASLSSHMATGGNAWLNCCFGGEFVAANSGYLPAVSERFGSASVYYGTGIQHINNGGIDSSPVLFPENGGLSYASNRYLNYQVYSPKTP